MDVAAFKWPLLFECKLRTFSTFYLWRKWHIEHTIGRSRDVVVLLRELSQTLLFTQLGYQPC